MPWTLGLRHAVVASIAAFCAFASAQQPPPTIPTPAELERERRKPVPTPDASKLPSEQLELPRQIRRPETEVKIDITRFEVNPEAPAPLKEALGRLTAAFVGPGRGFADMTDAAAEVTRYLQTELGYYLGYAYIPEQEPVDGVIHIQVLEGRLDHVELKWRDGLPVEREVVEAHLAQLRPGEVLKVRDLERVVFLVNDLRGMMAEFEIKAGQVPGTAILVVIPQPQPQTTGRVDFDNANVRTLGRNRLSGTVSRYSPLGRGDALNATVVGAKGLAFVLGSYVSPVGNDGLRLGVSASAEKYQVDKEEFPVDINGTASTVSVFGLYPVVRSRNLNLFALTSFDHKSYDDKTGSTGVKKHVSDIMLGLTGDLRDALVGGGLNSLDLQLMFGKLDFDVRPASNPPADRFKKLTARVVRLQNIVPGVLQGLVSVRVQKAFDNLDVTEQFRAGGPDGARAFPPGEGTGDNGALGTGELRFVMPQAWYQLLGGQAVASVFVDRAVVHIRNEPPLGSTEGNGLTFGDWGLGLNWLSPDGWELRASLAKRTDGQSLDQKEQGSTRLYLLIGKQF